MAEKKNFTERPIVSLIISIIGVLFIAFALANLFGLVDKPMENTKIIGGIILGIILMYPIFKKKTKK
jgi:uncharacterized membrane protein